MQIKKRNSRTNEQSAQFEHGKKCGDRGSGII